MEELPDVLIDPDDPYWEMLSVQYALRERFLIAILSILKEPVGDPSNYKDVYDRCIKIAQEAVDPKEIVRWLDELPDQNPDA